MQVVANQWTINGTAMGTTVSEVREWKLLELTYRYQTGSAAESATELLESISGQVSSVDLADGGFRSVSTGGSNVTVSASPPSRRSDVRPVNTWFVRSVERDNISTDGNAYEVTAELVPDISKEYDNRHGTFGSQPNPSVESGEWQFLFTYGDIATRNVSVEVSKESEGTIDIYTIETILDPTEVRIVEENVSHLNNVYLRTVPDGSDIVDDSSIDGRNTVAIAPPFGKDKPISSANYVFTSWETEWIGGGSYRVEWELARE